MLSTTGLFGFGRRSSAGGQRGMGILLNLAMSRFGGENDITTIVVSTWKKLSGRAKKRVFLHLWPQNPFLSGGFHN